MYETRYPIPHAYETDPPLILEERIIYRRGSQNAQRWPTDAPGRAEGQGNGKLDSPDKTGHAKRNGNPIHQQPKRRKA